MRKLEKYVRQLKQNPRIDHVKWPVPFHAMESSGNHQGDRLLILKHPSYPRLRDPIESLRHLCEDNWTAPNGAIEDLRLPQTTMMARFNVGRNIRQYLPLNPETHFFNQRAAEEIP